MCIFPGILDAPLTRGMTPCVWRISLLLVIPPRERVVVVLLRQVGDFPPHLVHVLQAERADAVLLLDAFDLPDAVLVLVFRRGGLRTVDVGGARDRELEAVLRSLLLLLAVDAHAHHGPRPA